MADSDLEEVGTSSTNKINPRRTKSSSYLFNYKVVKKKYMDNLKNYLNKKFQDNDVWSAERLFDITQELIKSYVRLRLAKNLVPTKMQFRLMRRFQVIECGGKFFLIMKRIPGSNKIRQVLPVEHFFDAMVKIHIKTGHKIGGGQKIINNLKDKYVIVKDCIDLFIDACNVCSTNNPFVGKTFNIKVVVEIVPINGSPFTSVLFYKDTATDFLILRPLLSQDYSAIAIELMKIFADFGAPNEIATPHTFFPDVIKLLESCFLPPKISFIETKGLASYVEDLLKKWMNKNRSLHWAIGCHLIQYEHNIVFKDNNSPYISVFGHKPFSFVDHPKEDIIDLEMDSSAKVDDTLTEETVTVENSDVISEETDGEDLDTEYLKQSKRSSKEKKCSECYSKLFKGYKCHDCSKLVHLFCSEPVNISNELIVICNSCVEVANNLKREINDL